MCFMYCQMKKVVFFEIYDIIYSRGCPYINRDNDRKEKGNVNTHY